MVDDDWEEAEEKEDPESEAGDGAELPVEEPLEPEPDPVTVVEELAEFDEDDFDDDFDDDFEAEIEDDEFGDDDYGLDTFENDE